MSSGYSSQLLLKDGLILIHDSQNHVVPTRAHVLIEGGTIIKIGPDVEASKGAEIVDCTDKIVSPGFVDTHHHGWQTQLKEDTPTNNYCSIWSLVSFNMTLSFHPVDS
jgi:cytosine/adenosine deaminase-related metal-dependent hydrolase